MKRQTRFINSTYSITLQNTYSVFLPAHLASPLQATTWKYYKPQLLIPLQPDKRLMICDSVVKTY